MSVSAVVLRAPGPAYRDGMSIILALLLLAHAAPVPMSPEQFANVSAGQHVQIAVRVDRVAGVMIYAELLRRITDTDNKPSGKHVVLYMPSGTPVVMAPPNAIVKGAVLFVYGTVASHDRVDASKVVVDTRFVHVE